MKKIKFGDIIIILTVVIVALCMLFLFGKKGGAAVVEVNGSAVKTFDLSEDSEYVYEGEYTNTIAVKNGKISVIGSDCPDKTCVHSGGISSSDRVICCLPNKLVIRVINDTKDVDVISG